MQKIAIVAPGLAHGAAGGVQRVAEWLGQMLTRSAEFDVSYVSVATSRNDSESVRLLRLGSWLGGPKLADFEIDGIKGLHAGATMVELEPMRYLPRCQLTTYLNQFDLVQVVAGTPAVGNLASGVEVPVCIQAATTTVSERMAERSAGDPARRVLGAISKLVIPKLEQRALRSASHIFVENKWMVQQCRTLTSTAVSLAPPGVDTDFFVPRPGGSRGEYLLTVGRLTSERKNFLGLIRSYAAGVKTHGLELPLVIAGAGPLPDELPAEAARLGVENWVRFVTDPEPSELLGLYQDAAVFVLASHEEGLGLVFVEAMACGIPLVATRSEGAAEIFDRGAVGALVPCFRGSSAELTAGLVRWGQSGSDQTVAKCSREVAVSQFGNEAALRRFTDVYESILQ